MPKITPFVIWICSKFTRQEIEQIIHGLLEVIENRNPEVKPKDDFKEKHPNYRNFYVDPNPPLPQIPKPKKNYKSLLQQYQSIHGRALSPVQQRGHSPKVPPQSRCPHCQAPHSYIYFNNGKKKSQLKCKVCMGTFTAGQKVQRQSKYICPYCRHALFKWKARKDVTIYKCCNDHCPHRLKALHQLNNDEQRLQKLKKSQFKLNYQYREYHFKPQQLQHASPAKSKIELTKIHNSQNILGLILAFYVSFAISARKTAFILKTVFNIHVSYQTVLNYAEAAAYYCHRFNLHYKGPIDNISAGDETYIKIKGKPNYVFFFISAKSLKITAYHPADNRGTLPATTAMREAIRTADKEQKITLITDGNPAYPAGIHFINAQSTQHQDIQHRKVIGLQNLDQESEEFRPFKQLIERLNRTYKHHVKPSHGFNSFNGALCLTTLFVTHYNFLRPHMSLQYKTPVQIPQLNDISTIQGKWAKIIALAA